MRGSGRRRHLDAATALLRPTFLSPEHGKLAPNLAALGFDSTPVEGVPWPPEYTVTSDGYRASLTLADGRTVHIDHEGRLTVTQADGGQRAE